ncbi:hypothetical protein BCR61_19745 [Xanthomonas oryzae pv. oryzae]|nr:hypothetical protein BCR61_19745 [Xanthomonas oryzae pv. oryzae]AXQ76444.1 hypothetical protein BXU03_19435 [Xanthomonas oryzae pv. oryzae]
MICSSEKRFFTSNLLGVGNWTPNGGATQNRGDATRSTSQPTPPAARAPIKAAPRPNHPSAIHPPCHLYANCPCLFPRCTEKQPLGSR